MLSIGSVGSSGGAATYFAKDNYYTASQGLGESEWFGKGAEALGLSNDPSERTDQITALAELQSEGGHDKANEQDSISPDAKDSSDKQASNDAERDPESAVDRTAQEGGVERNVDAEQFKAVLDGFTNGNRVGYESKDGDWKHKPGKDLVFAPSKSVSVMALVAGDTRIVTAFKESVKETLAYAERNYAARQVKQPDGSVKSEKTGNITAALFTHDTSRNQDPLLHIHAVLGNLTQDRESGEWKSLWMRPFYENRFKLSQMQDNILEKKLQDIGYKTIRTQKGHVEIEAVPSELTKAYSTRRAEIEERISDDSHWNERQTATYDTRKSKVELDRSELGEVWINQALDHGFDPREHIPAEKIQKEQSRGYSPKDLAMTINDASDHLTENSVTLTRADLVQDVQLRSPNHVALDVIEQGIDEKIKSGALIEHGETHTGDATYTTAHQVGLEKDIVSRLEASKGTAAISESRSTVSSMVDKTTLRDPQKGAAIGMLTTKGRYIAIQGNAGSGKTYSVGQSIKILETLAPKRWGKNIKIHGFAPTKNAAKQLSSDIGKHTETTQWFLAKHKSIANGYEPSKEALSQYKGSILVLDETSMQSNSDMSKLMTIADKLEVRKVYLVGDVNQHESVKAGPALRLLHKSGMPVLEVDDITRQKDERLLEAAKAHAAGDLDTFFDKVNQDIKEGDNYIKEAAIDYAMRREAGQAASDIIVVSPDNKTRQAVNNEIRIQMQARNMIAKDSHEHPILKPLYTSTINASYASSYTKGDVLMFNQDLASKNIKRGDTWKVDAVNLQKRTLSLSNGGTQMEWVLKRYEDSAPFEHMKPGEIQLAIKDEIRFKNEDTKHNLEREQLGRVSAIDDKHIFIKHEDGRVIKLDKNERAAKIIDHAYTTTTYAAQGLTKDTSILVAEPKSQAVSQVSSYVAATRERHEFSLFTRDKEQFIAQVKSNSGQEVHALDAKGLNKDKPTSQKDKIADISKGREKSKDISRQPTSKGIQR